MEPARTHRSLIAWTLYGCVLFNLFACAIAHGQMAGLQLSGIGGLFCSAQGNTGPGFDGDLGGLTGGGSSVVFKCPLCASPTIALGLGLLFALYWLRRLAGSPSPRREQRRKSPPRYAWPSANPRAP